VWLLRNQAFRRFHLILTAISAVLLIVNLIEGNWLQVAGFGLFALAWIQLVWFDRLIKRYERGRD
jgi:hypothetical protein